MWFRETELAQDHTAQQALIILHGLFGSSINWRSFAKTLADRGRVFSLDLRNHGASPHVDGMDYDLMAADVRFFMDKQGLESAVWLGHSMGGKVAMRAALATPERVSRLIVADIAPVVYQRDFSELLASLLALDLERINSRDDADAQLRQHIPEQGLRRFLLQNLERQGERLVWRVNLRAIHNNLENILGFPIDSDAQQYLGDVLFLRGESSDYIQPEHEARMRHLFPNLRIETINGAGHWLHTEQPARVATCINAFLESTC